jgi:hypothetical protein
MINYGNDVQKKEAEIIYQNMKSSGGKITDIEKSWISEQISDTPLLKYAS